MFFVCRPITWKAVVVFNHSPVHCGVIDCVLVRSFDPALLAKLAVCYPAVKHWKAVLHVADAG